MSDYIPPSTMKKTLRQNAFDTSSSSEQKAMLPVPEEARNDSVRISRTRQGSPLDRDSSSKRNCTSIFGAFIPSIATEHEIRESTTSSTPDVNDNSSGNNSPAHALVENSPRTSEENTDSATPEKQITINNHNYHTGSVEHQRQVGSFNVDGWNYAGCSAEDREAVENLIYFRNNPRIANPLTSSLPPKYPLELSFREIEELVERPPLPKHAQDVLDAANSLIQLLYGPTRETSRTSQEILEYASLKASNICPDSIEQVVAQVNANAFDFQVLMARDVPQGYEVFQVMEQSQCQVQFGSLPPVSIDRTTGRATSSSNPSTVVDSKSRGNVVKENVVYEDTAPEAVVLEAGAPNCLLESLVPRDMISELLLPEFLVPEPVTSEHIAIEQVVSEDSVLEAILSDVVPEVVAQEEVVSILDNAISEVLSKAVVLDKVPESDTPKDVAIPEATIIISEDKRTKRSKKNKNKKKKKNALKLASTHELSHFLEIQERFQRCAANLKTPMREMQECLRVLGPLLREQREAKERTIIFSGTGGIGETVQETDQVFLDCVRDVDFDVDMLGDHLRYATAMLFYSVSEALSIVKQLNDKTNSKFSDENVATASWICSSPAPDTEIKGSSYAVHGSNINPLSEITSSANLPSDCETSLGTFVPSIPSDASRSLATPSEELSFSLSSASSQSEAVSPKNQSPILEESFPQETVNRCHCFCHDGADSQAASKGEPRELRNPFSSFKRPRPSRSNSLPLIRTSEFQEKNGKVEERTEDKDPDPTKLPLDSTTYVPVTRKIVACLLGQQLPVYASWQIWYYPGPFIRGKGPRTNQIPLGVKITSVGRNASHNPTYRVPSFDESFDSRFIVSLEDGSFLPVIPTEDEHRHIMLSYKDYLEYGFFLTINNKTEHRMYSFKEPIFHLYQSLYQKSSSSERVELKERLQEIWDIMKAAAIQRLNENIQWEVST